MHDSGEAEGSMGLALLWSKIKKLKITLSFASPEKKIIILYLRSDCEAIFL